VINLEEDNMIDSEEQFMKISAVYDLPDLEVLNEHHFSLNRIFPELGLDVEWEHQEVIHADGRLVIKRVEFVYINGDDEDQELTTLWFDGKPFAVLRTVRDNRKRWVTDYAVFYAAMAYAVTRVGEMAAPDDHRDYLAPDTELPVETIFAGSLGTKHGIQKPVIGPADRRFMLGHVLHELEAETHVVMSKIAQPPALLRRGNWFVSLERDFSAAELIYNKKLFMPDSPYQKDGFRYAFVYRTVDERPENYKEAVVF
jgi:hypothetical protein